VIAKELEQVHAILGTLGPAYTAPERYAGFLLNAVLGGSMSSRLFQEIREKRGLAYSIHSYLVSYRDIGKFGVYVGTSEDKFRQVIDLILAELERIRSDVLTERELSSAREQIKGNFLLGMESTDNRMTRLAKNELYFERQVTVEETLEKVDSVKAEEVLALAENLFHPDRLSIAAIGRVAEDDILRR
jgi:predicted Zn-dependent peptidase